MQKAVEAGTSQGRAGCIGRGLYRGLAPEVEPLIHGEGGLRSYPGRGSGRKGPAMDPRRFATLKTDDGAGWGGCGPGRVGRPFGLLGGRPYGAVCGPGRPGLGPGGLCGHHLRAGGPRGLGADLFAVRRGWGAFGADGRRRPGRNLDGDPELAAVYQDDVTFGLEDESELLLPDRPAGRDPNDPWGATMIHVAGLGRDGDPILEGCTCVRTYDLRHADPELDQAVTRACAPIREIAGQDPVSEVELLLSPGGGPARRLDRLRWRGGRGGRRRVAVGQRVPGGPGV
jgi:hypothetical protein